MLFFYSSLLAFGIILIMLVLVIEKRKTKLVPNNFIRDKLSEFLKITPVVHKIEILEQELRQIENSPVNIGQEKVGNEDNWKTKYARLETIFQEKSTVLGKIEEALNNEIRNRGEFENFRYLLEEEIEKSKEKRRQLQAELASLKMENENLRSKITELESQDSLKIH